MMPNDDTKKTEFWVDANPALKVVTLHRDGRIELHDGASVDDAAHAFWQAVLATASQYGFHAEPAVERLVAALRQIVENEMPCDKCGHVHTPQAPLGTATARSWADPEDGHAYYPIAVRDFAACTLAEFGQQPTGDERE